MSIVKHIQEHSKLSLPFPGGNNFLVTVGVGGKYNTLAAAVAAVNAQNRFVPAAVPAFVATSASTSAGTVDVRRLNSDGVNDLLNVRGKILGLQVATGPIFLGRVNNADFIDLFAPLHVDVTSVTFNLYEITRACIFLLPGTHLVDVPTTIIPAYTTIFGMQGTCSITMASSAFLSHNEVDGAGFSPNETFIDGVDINAFQYTFAPNNNVAVLYPSEAVAGWGTQTNFGMRRMTLRGGSTDGILFTTSNLALFGGGISGQFTMQDVRGYGQYDLLRGGQFRMLRITNCELYARASVGLDTEAVILGIGNANAILAIYPKQQMIIEGSLLDVRNYLAGDNATEIQCIDIRNPLPSNTTILIKNNTLIARDTVAENGTGDCTAVIVGAFVTGTNTPNIVVANNDIHVSNASIGTARLMHSNNANYIIQHENNRIIPSDNGIAGVSTMGSNLRRIGTTTTVSATPVAADHSASDTVDLAVITTAIAINAPINGIKGKHLTFLLLEDATAGHAITWNATYKFMAAFVQSVVTTDANKRTQVEFVYDGANYRQVSAANVWIA